MKKILFISHDANRAGAQLFLFNIMLALKSEGYTIVLLILNDWGNLKSEFEENFETYFLNKKKPNSTFNKLFSKEKSTLELINENHTFDIAYANTIVSVDILKDIKAQFNCKIISHIHELAYSIHQFGSKNSLKNLFEFSDEIIACSKAVAKNLELNRHAIKDKIKIVHSFINNDAVLAIHKNNISKDELFQTSDFLIGACGNADWRKAPDIFLLIAKKVSETHPDIKFVWIGIDKKDPLYHQLDYDVKKLGIRNQIVWIEKTTKSIELINALDVFLVCSREDPFPLVMLEAAICKKPILGFKNTGGAEEFIETDAGYLSNYLDIETISNQIISLKLNSNLVKSFGEIAQKKVLSLYNFESSLIKIKAIINNV